MTLRQPLLLLLVAAAAACYPDPDEVRARGRAGGAGGPSSGGAGDASGAGGGTPINPQRPCTDYAQALCKRLGACWPEGLKLSFGDEARCQERVKLNCELTDLRGSNWPSKDCVAAYVDFDCTEFNNGLDPVACGAPGDLPDSAACADETQCQGRRCLVSQGMTCGRCASKQPEGGQCLSDASCTRGLVCGQGTCVRPGALGADCSAARPCQDVLTCRGGKCVAPGKDGAPCTSAADCDGFAGFGCGAAGKCVRFTVAGTCRNNEDGTFELCEARGACNASTRTCTRPAADGASCNDDRGPRCLFPAACAGTCRLPMLRNACPASAMAPGPRGARLLETESGARPPWRRRE